MKNFTHPELEKRVMRALSQAKVETEISSEQAATLNKPSQSDLSLKGFFSPINFLHQVILDDIEKEMQVSSLIKSVYQKRKSTEEMRRDIEFQKATTRKEFIEIDSNNLERPTINKKQVLIYKISVASISVLEGGMSQSVFEEMGSSYFLSWIFAIVFAICIGLVTHQIPKIVVKFGITIAKARITILAILSILFSVFYAMASIRVASYTEFGAQITYSAFFFALLSTFFVSVGAWAVHLFAPSKDDIRALEHYESVVSKRNTLEQKVQQLQIQSNTQQSEAIQFEQDRHSQYSFATSLEWQVIHHAQYCYSLYKQINILKRPDGTVPHFFDDETYPFELKTRFINHLETLGGSHENT